MTTDPSSLICAAEHESRLMDACPILTPRQFREQLIREGLLSTVGGIIAAIPDPTEQAIAENWFDFASTIERSHPMVIQVGALIGKSPDQIDTFFRAAAKL